VKKASRRIQTRPPTVREIDQLLVFLPRLTADGFTPVRRWRGGEKTEDGGFMMPWPVYNEVVKEFFEAASQECWNDGDCVPVDAGRLLEGEQRVRRAGVDEIRTMLTYCVRGERFCDGHWGAMIAEGHVRRLLERLAEVSSTLAERLCGSEG